MVDSDNPTILLPDYTATAVEKMLDNLYRGTSTSMKEGDGNISDLINILHLQNYMPVHKADPEPSIDSRGV